jgi:Domain of unknown function (DUF1996)
LNVGLRRSGRFAAALVLVVVVSMATPAWASSGWVVFCGYSHSATDDPIVYPGVHDKSHLHDFFGNETTSASSTDASMLGQATTCQTPEDTGAFWTPALFSNGKRVLPEGAPPNGTETDYHARTQVYYQNNLTGLPPSAIQPIPAGLRMVAGNSTAASAKQNPLIGREIYWGCSNNQPDGKFPTPIDCATGIESLHVGFPNCWDGSHLDSPDHQSHMAFPVSAASGYVCPKDHPVPIPRVIVRIEYPIGTDPSGVSLSSGKTFTVHGDFWNTWDQPTLARLTATCLNANTDCGVNPNPSARHISTAWKRALWGLVGLAIAFTGFAAGFRSAPRSPGRAAHPRGSAKNTVEPLRQMDLPS